MNDVAPRRPAALRRARGRELLPWLYGVAANVVRNRSCSERRRFRLRERLVGCGRRTFPTPLTNSPPTTGGCSVPLPGPVATTRNYSAWWRGNSFSCRHRRTPRVHTQCRRPAGPS
ncbi:MAG: hypothetical protein R2705_14980 [Ilumatobacteraceae bacterium]